MKWSMCSREELVKLIFILHKLFFKIRGKWGHIKIKSSYISPQNAKGINSLGNHSSLESVSNLIMWPQNT